jgi:NADH-quinone oxidoreductase subunit J
MNLFSGLLLAAGEAKAAHPAWREIVTCPTAWGLLLGVIGLWLMVPRAIRIRGLIRSIVLGNDAHPPPVRHGKTVGGVLLLLALGLIGADLPWLANPLAQGVFWAMAAVALIAAVSCITAQSPVYSALWFALSVLGTSGLFFLSGAQFLSVATIVVYAGAIVVTFLFVLMLAQPEGHASYDRITWGWFPRTISVLVAGGIVAMLTLVLGGLKDQAQAEGRDLQAKAVLAAAKDAKATSDESLALKTQPAHNDILTEQHMARLGGYLFTRHLISIEVAGTLLLAALVGAVAIAIQGKQRDRVDEALSTGTEAGAGT